MKAYLEEMRVKHYIKNLILFFPLFFNGAFLKYQNWLSLIFGTMSFCFCASLIYITNDIQDISKDKNHPTNCKRPIASGVISIACAKRLCVILACSAVLSIILAVKLGAGAGSALVLAAYFVLNVAYSVWHLKDVALLDIIILASGFVLRLMMGSALTQIPVSTWLYLVILCGAFYLGFGKRRNELHENIGCGRKVLKYYTENFLTMSMYSCMSLTIVFFSLWCIDKHQDTVRFDYLWFVPIIMVLFFKYNLDLEQENSTGDPTEILLGDHVLQIVCAVAVILMFINIYV